MDFLRHKSLLLMVFLLELINYLVLLVVKLKQIYVIELGQRVVTL
jgi:hypothetical protein